MNRELLCIIGIHDRNWKLHVSQPIPEHETYTYRCRHCGHIKEFLSVHISHITDLDLTDEEDR